MTGFKNVFASKTVLTALVGAIFALLNIFDVVAIDPDLQASIVTVLFTAAGIFRFTATEQLTTSTTT